jgi:alpha-L-fucosidase
MPNQTPSLDWFVKARYGLFIHYGLYSLLGRAEWVMNREAIAPAEYSKLAGQFTAEKFDAEALADLAVRSGMHYIVLTTMHHDGFRLYDTKLSNYSTAKTAARRDLVAELLAAARKRNLRVGLYHSLNNWYDQPDSVDALENEQAKKVFVDAAHARLKELAEKYKPFDVMWYDGWWPFNADGWRGQEMNAMIRKIQPDILFNGRNGLPGDFATPEGHMGSPTPWRPWEGCMTMNNSWGFHAGDHEWKTPQQVVDLLVAAASGKGNLLLNIGPRGDGSVPKESVDTLLAVGDWIKRCGECVFDTDLWTMDLQTRGKHRGDWCNHGPITIKGNALYLLVRRWTGNSTLTLRGLDCRVTRATMLPSNAPLTYTQKGDLIVITGLPSQSPDPVCPVIRFDCDRPPSMYLTGGMREPKVPHPHYDPCPSDLPAGHRPG